MFEGYTLIFCRRPNGSSVFQEENPQAEKQIRSKNNVRVHDIVKLKSGFQEMKVLANRQGCKGSV